jgi:aspartate kinase
MAFKVLESLKDIPLRMVSYGGSSNNISVLVNSIHKKDALVALNKGLFGY